jgi:hypothetical protein
VTKLRAGRPRSWGFSITSRPSLRSTQPPIERIPEPVSSELKRSGSETDHPTPINADVNNVGLVHPLPHISSWCDARLVNPRDSFFVFSIAKSPSAGLSFSPSHHISINTTQNMWERQKICLVEGQSWKNCSSACYMHWFDSEFFYILFNTRKSYIP